MSVEPEVADTEVEGGEGEGDEVAAEAVPEEPPLSKSNIAKALSQIGRCSKDRNTFTFTRLEMKKKGLKSLEGDLIQFQDLQYVDLSDNELAELEGLKVLKNIMTLNVQRNQIKKFDSFGTDNEALLLLQLDQNQLESFADFDMPSLKCLSASHNKLTDLHQLEMPVTPALELLNLSNNQLVSLDGVDRLQHLRQLSIANNQITSLEGIQSCFKLQVLDVSNNQLPSVDEFEKLTGCNVLTKLTATGNAAIYDTYSENPRGLFMIVAFMLPKLKTFDAFDVDEEVRIEVDGIRKKKEAEFRATQAAELAEAQAAAAAAVAASSGSNIPEDVSPLNLAGIAPDGGVEGNNLSVDQLETAMSTNITDEDAA